MSEIIKTKAIVLRKINFGDTSKIATFYTEDFGRISGIVKGARSPKSRTGMLIDSMNLVEVVFYKKENRDVQLISQVDLISHFPRLKEDLDKTKYATAVLELIINIMMENESHPLLFKGTVRFFELLNNNGIDPKWFFLKYYLFFLREIGYGIQFDECSICGKPFSRNQHIFFNYEKGMFCSDCSHERITTFEFQPELFNLLLCLNSKNNDIAYEQKNLDKIIYFLERYLSYHVPEFKGIKSFHLF